MTTDEIVNQRETLARGIRWAIGRMGASPLHAKALRLAVSPTTLNRWTTGACAPGEANLARLARLSGAEQEDIRNGGPNEHGDH